MSGTGLGCEKQLKPDSSVLEARLGAELSWEGGGGV